MKTAIGVLLVALVLGGVAFANRHHATSENANTDCTITEFAHCAFSWVGSLFGGESDGAVESACSSSDKTACEMSSGETLGAADARLIPAAAPAEGALACPMSGAKEEACSGAMKTECTEEMAEACTDEMAEACELEAKAKDDCCAAMTDA